MNQKISLIATVLGTIVAIIAYFWPPDPGKETRSVSQGPATASPVSQVAGPNSTQISNVTGPVTVNNQMAPPAEQEQADIVGSWDGAKARELAMKTLRDTNWRSIDKSIELPLNHTMIGEYNLLYRSKEGIVLAFATITKGSECHACMPHLSYFEFDKRSTGWKLIGSYVGVQEMGSWGKPPKLSIAVIADDRFGVLLESGYMAQGWINELTMLHARMGDKFVPVLNLLTFQSDPEDRAWKSTLAFRPTSTGLYEIVVSRSGVGSPANLKWMDAAPELRPDVANEDGRIRERDIFRFNGQTYARSAVIQ